MFPSLSPKLIFLFTAIGWSLAGSTNSPNSHLSLLYQTARDEIPRISTLPSRTPHRTDTSPLSITDGSFVAQPTASNPMIRVPGPSACPALSSQLSNHPADCNTIPTIMPSVYIASTSSPAQVYQQHSISPTPLSDLPSTFRRQSRVPQVSPPTLSSTGITQGIYGAPFSQQQPLPPSSNEYFDPNNSKPNPNPNPNQPDSMEGIQTSHCSHSGSPYSDTIIESQDVDASTLPMDTMLWLDYMPTNALGIMYGHPPGPTAEVMRQGGSGSTHGHGHI